MGFGTTKTRVLYFFICWNVHTPFFGRGRTAWYWPSNCSSQVDMSLLSENVILLWRRTCGYCGETNMTCDHDWWWKLFFWRDRVRAVPAWTKRMRGVLTGIACRSGIRICCFCHLFCPVPTLMKSCEREWSELEDTSQHFFSVGMNVFSSYAANSLQSTLWHV